MLGVGVYAAQTDEEARLLRRRRFRRSSSCVAALPGKLPPPVESIAATL